MKLCNFSGDQFGEVWSISLHFILSTAILLFSLCFRIFSLFLTSSISFHQFLLLSLCLTLFPDFEISVSIILEGFCPFHLEGRTPTAPTWLSPALSAWHQPQPNAVFTSLIKFMVMLSVRVEKTIKPRVPGTLQLQKACQGQPSTGPTLLPPHLSASHHPCAWHLSKWLLSLLCLGLGSLLKLVLRKPQSLELQEHFNYKSHAEGEHFVSSHYIWLQSLHFRIFFYFFPLNLISLKVHSSVYFTFFWFQDFISFLEMA